MNSAISLNTFDYCIITVILLSALASFRRGITREVLSIGAWAAAASVTFYALPLLRCFGRDLIGNTLIGDAVTAVVIFLFTFITCAFIIQSISATIRDSGLNSLDRSLGIVFGVARAGFLIVLLFMGSGFIWKTPDARPPILRTSRTLPYIAESSRMVAKIIPSSYCSNDFIEGLTKTFEISPQQMMFQLANPTPKDIDSGSDKKSEYKHDQRRDMNRLFQNYAE